MNVPVSIQEQIRERVLKIDPLEGLGKNDSLRTELLITTPEMVDNSYPFPDGTCIVATKDKYAPVTKESPIFALDCEMCVTSAGVHELTRISLDVQAAMRTVLPPDAILCGHSLEFDLRAMQMAHPYCIDIGLIYNLSGTERMKTSLKNLMSVFFDEDIQNSHGHCSVEDAWCAMRLLKMKLENGLVFCCASMYFLPVL
ncbi:exonuclease [Cooperia oncophora]